MKMFSGSKNKNQRELKMFPRTKYIFGNKKKVFGAKTLFVQLSNFCVNPEPSKLALTKIRGS
jgi:hypothetical protein